MTKSKINHEASHAVVAIYYGIRFNSINGATIAESSSSIRDLSTNETNKYQANAVVKTQEQVNVSWGSVRFPVEAYNSPFFKISVVAGCLGEFYKQWYNRNLGKILQKMPTTECRTLIDSVISVFCYDNYPDDYDNFTNGQKFDPIEYLQCLEKAFPIVEKYWQEILLLSDQIKDNPTLSYDEVIHLLRDSELIKCAKENG